MVKKDFRIKVLFIKDLIKKLEGILEHEGNLPVLTHNNPYFDNQFGFPIDTFNVEIDPKNVKGVVERGNRDCQYDGLVLFID